LKRETPSLSAWFLFQGWGELGAYLASQLPKCGERWRWFLLMPHKEKI
jgi:hypothetical protein